MTARLPASGRLARASARALATLFTVCAVPLAAQTTTALKGLPNRLPHTSPHTSPNAAAPDAEFTLVPHRTRWAIDVQVGGRPFRFGLDTGGGLTIVSAAVARASGCTVWGRVTGFQMMGQRLDAPRCDGLPVTITAGGTAHRFTSATAAVIAPASVEPNDRALDGSLALDVFEGRVVTLDLGAGRLTVESPASLTARVAAMTPLPIRVQRELGGRALSVFAAVPTAKGTLWMELDSGNGGTVLVSKPYAALLGLDSAAAGPQPAHFPVLPTAQPPVQVDADRAFVPDMIVDGNLGMPFLRHWILTLDLAAGRAWIAPSAAPGAASSAVPSPAGR